HVSLNKEISEELEAELEDNEHVEGFVHVDRLVELDKEDEFLLERENDAQEDATNDEQDNESTDENETAEENASEESNEENVEEEPTNDEQSNEEEKQSDSEEAQSDDKSDDEAATEETEEEKENNEMSTFASKPQTSSTSRLGHIRGGDDRKIYKTLGGKSTQPSSKHWNKVYYIKRQAKMDSETYYLLSRSPSASKNVVGWMNAKDLETHKHQGDSRESHQMIIKGTGRATSKARGGSKDTVHQSMKSFTGDSFDINLTEKVGKNTWYRGKINSTGQNVWLHSSHVDKDAIKETNYKLPVSEAVAIQMKRSPFIMNGSHGFVAKSRVNSNLKMKAGSTNVRTMTRTVSNRDNNIIKKLQGGTKIKPIAEVGKWYAIEVGGSRKTAALPQQVEQSLDPDNHL